MGTTNRAYKTIEMILGRFFNDDFVIAWIFITCLVKNTKGEEVFENLRVAWEEIDLINVAKECEKISYNFKNYNDNEISIYDILLETSKKVLIFYNSNQLTLRKDIIKDIFFDMNSDDMLYILNAINKKTYYGANDTPSSIIQLTKNILDIKDNEYFADLCCGRGTFLSHVNETKNTYGCDINYDSLYKGYILNFIKKATPLLEHVDIFTLNDKKFDKIYMEFPWGYIYQKPFELLNAEHWLPLPIKDLKRSMTSWAFISKAMSFLSTDGLAAILVNDGCLTSTYEEKVRKNAIELGLIKAIISLPNKITPYSNVKCSLIILSYGNSCVQFIDATNLGRTERFSKTTILDDNEIDLICDLLKKKEINEISAVMDNKLLIEENTNLNVAQALGKNSLNLKILNGKKIDKIKDCFVKSVIANSFYLDKNNNSTGIRVLSSSDIKNGSVDVSTLPYLSEDGISSLNNKWQQNLINDGDVVVTNKSTTIKSAVINTKGEKIILFGSLVGIRVKKDLIFPEYLCAFINSNAGQALLKSIQTGATIQMITLNNLNNLEIPCPDIKKQKEFVEDLLITLEMIKECKERITKLETQYQGSFDSLFKEE